MNGFGARNVGLRAPMSGCGVSMTASAGAHQMGAHTHAALRSVQVKQRSVDEKQRSVEPSASTFTSLGFDPSIFSFRARIVVV
jgi:hypothetical protein